MRIAVTHENGEVFQNFKNLKEVIVFTERDGKIVSEEILAAEEYKGAALVGFLVFNDVDVLISGGIDGELLASLLSVGIKIYPGVKGDCLEEALKYISGSMDFKPNSSCHHHH